MAKIKSIKVKDLLVNTENFRFEPLSGQKEAIDKMLDALNEKLYNLGSHIAENGMDPSAVMIVSPSTHDKGMFNVLEGNRRTISLKLMAEPNLIDNQSHEPLKRKFKKLHEQYKKNPITEVACVVFDNPDDANKWIKLKHTGANEGIGTVDWNKQQIDRFNEKVEGKASTALQVIKMLNSSKETPTSLKNKLGEIPLSNMERLISDPYVREFLGITLHDGQLESNIEKKEVMKGLVQVAKDLLNPDFNVNKIYFKDDRKDYVSKFPKNSTPDKNVMAKKAWRPGEAPNRSQPTVKVGSGKKATFAERNNLIPKSCILHITNPKVNAIYKELQKIKTSDYVNACAVLLRAFIELSADCYRDEHKLTKAPSSGGDSASLQTKMLVVIDHLTNTGKIDKVISKGMRDAMKDYNGFLGIETLHAYVHSSHYTPKPKELLTTWDNIQRLMEILWENIK